MITYTKTITSLQAYKELDGEANVVYNIYWNMVGTDGTYTSSYGAMTYVPVVAGASFIPFDQLTEEIVMGWIDTYTPLVLIEQYQNSVNQLILAQQQLETPPLPWQPVTPVYTNQ
jgi:hypothetical protein